MDGDRVLERNSGLSGADRVEVTDESAIHNAVGDYVDGWFDGDSARMERALHPELIKRCRGLEGDDPDALETLSATT